MEITRKMLITKRLENLRVNLSIQEDLIGWGHSPCYATKIMYVLHDKIEYFGKELAKL